MITMIIMITGIIKSPPIINAGIISSLGKTFFSGKIVVLVVAWVLVVVVDVDVDDEIEPSIKYK